MTPLYREKTLITEMITGNGAFVHTLPPPLPATPRYFLMKKTGMFVVSLRGRNCGFKSHFRSSGHKSNKIPVRVVRKKISFAMIQLNI